MTRHSNKSRLATEMPVGYWGQWRLESSRGLFTLGDITVFDCWATEHVQDEFGVAASSSLSDDPTARHLVLGAKPDGTVTWLKFLSYYGNRLSAHRDGSSIIIVSPERAIRVDVLSGVETAEPTIYRAPAFALRCDLAVPDFRSITDELLDYFSLHPEHLHKLSPRHFEELLEAIFRNQGYTTELGPGSRDGGVDLRLIQKDSIGEIVTLVQAKRYAPHRPIRLEAVSGLYGIVERRAANRGLFVTTSRYLPGARRFAEERTHRLTLASPEDVARWCKRHTATNDGSA